MRARRSGTARVWVAAGLVVLALAGCSSGGSDEAASSAGDTRADAPAAAPEQLGEDTDQQAAAEPAAAGAGQAQQKPDQQKPAEQGRTPGKQPAQAPDPAIDQRAIIYTGSITVRVDDVNAAAARVTGIVTGAGGFIGGDKRSSNGKRGTAEATLTLRVPADRFTAVVDELAGLGTEERRGLSTEDVTEESIDLDARITTQRARVATGRTLLAQAKDLEDLVMLEREVATREADLASLEAKKRRLADLTALSTITAVLLDPETDLVEPDEPERNAFLAGLVDGWNGLTASLGVVVTVLGWLLPWAVLLGVPAWLIFWARRRRRTAPVPALAEKTAD